ncbi:glycosyltransferase [bacterium]|nr:glycosyltransferase [bacterium]
MTLKISIIIPNYNGEKTLRRTLSSLTKQNYEAIEIIVVDGGSKDSSIDIIKEFDHVIHWWVSEPDSGQSNAINKGFSHCTGDIVNWICSDDVLAPNALEIISQRFLDFPDTDVLVGAGMVQFTETSSIPASRSSLTWLKNLKTKPWLPKHQAKS